MKVRGGWLELAKTLNVVVIKWNIVIIKVKGPRSRSEVACYEYEAKRSNFEVEGQRSAA